MLFLKKGLYSSLPCYGDIICSSPVSGSQGSTLNALCPLEKIGSGLTLINDNHGMLLVVMCRLEIMN